MIPLWSTWAEPRFFGPAFLRIGAINELYVWDEVSVAPFTVEVWKDGASKPLLTARGFSVNRPLPVLGAAKKPLLWAAALVCPEVLEAPGPVKVRFLTSKGELLHETPSQLMPRNFPVEEIPLSPEMTRLRAKPDPRKDREAVAIWAVYQRFEPQFHWPGGRFLLPVSPIFPSSAHFGDVRHYQYADGTSSRDYHRGTDFAVPVGTPVQAPAPGTVVLVADRMLTGITVVLEHAPGVYSVFFHLSKANVKVGQKVKAAERLALSGATGLATGPHLHWEVRSNGVPVDPLDLVTDGLLDTNSVSAVISSIERVIH